MALVIDSDITQTHSSHALERVWWTPAYSLVQPILRIWGVLILNWLVLNNFTRGDDHCPYVMKPLPSVWFSNEVCQKWFPCHLSVLWAAYTVDVNNAFEDVSKDWNLILKVRVVASRCICRNHHPLCSYSPPIS